MEKNNTEGRMAKNPVPRVAQEMRIKELLASRRPRENMSIMARNLGEPYGSVAGNIYGYRANAPLQAKIAEYLGMPMAELFGDNGESSIQAV